jgi:tetratricopeptide (TPR) repeat protein
MALRFKVRISQTLLLLVAFSVFVPAGTPDALAQRLPSDTERERKNKPASSRREGRPKPQPAPVAAKTSVSVESGNFLALGNDFRKQKKWKAAEAAYKEAVKVWPANVDALLELGLLYLNMNKIDEALQTHIELRSLNATYASTLLAEINKHKH